MLGGGVERLAADWAAGLAARHHDVHLVTPRAPLWPRGRMSWRGVVVHPLESDRYRERGAEVAARLRPDVVHVHNRPGWVPDLPPPAVVSLHNPPAGWLPPGSEQEPSWRDTFAAAAAVLPVSGWLAAVVRPALPAGVPLTVVRGHVDLEAFRPTGTKSTSFRVAFAGKLDPKKGLDVLLDSIDEPPLRSARLAVCSPLPPVAGFEPWQEAVLRRATAHPRVDVLLPLSSPSDLAAVLTAASSVADPTVGDEAFGLVSIEAQACGTRVVVSDSGGLPETVLPGVTGHVVPRGDASALADALADVARLSGDPRRFVETEFALPSRVDELEAIYDSLTGGSAARA